MPVVVVDMAVVGVVDEVVVVEPVFIVGMTAADSFSLSALSSDQYLFPERDSPTETGISPLTEATCLILQHSFKLISHNIRIYFYSGIISDHVRLGYQLLAEPDIPHCLRYYKLRNIRCFLKGFKKQLT